MPLPGQPKDTPIPPSLNRWNWGAFLLNWIWGLGNSTYIALLMFVPFVNIVMLFVLGAKGSKWAWKNRLWEDEEHFKRVQRKWALAGIAVLVGFVLLFGLMFYSIVAIMKGSDAYKNSMSLLRSHPQVVETLGEPIEAGWFMSGNTNISGPDGVANLSIPITGPKGSGTAISRAKKIAGVWEIYLLVVRVEGQSSPIVLINKNNTRIPNGAIET